MTDHINVTGTIGTDPDYRTVGQNGNLPRLTFRLASTERRVTTSGTWEDAHTNWYSVTAFGRVAANAKPLLKKGQRVMLSGKLRINQYSREDGSSGTTVEIIASHLGGDLAFARGVGAAQDAVAAPASGESVGEAPAQGSAVQDGAAQGWAQDGAAQNGAAQGWAQDGTAQDGAAQNGAAQGWAQDAPAAATTQAVPAAVAPDTASTSWANLRPELEVDPVF